LQAAFKPYQQNLKTDPNRVRATVQCSLFNHRQTIPRNYELKRRLYNKVKLVHLQRQQEQLPPLHSSILLQTCVWFPLPDSKRIQQFNSTAIVKRRDLYVEEIFESQHFLNRDL